MDGLTLLAEARGAGLTVERADERLVIRGPRAAEALARRMIERKADVLAALEAEAVIVLNPTTAVRGERAAAESGGHRLLSIAGSGTILTNYDPTGAEALNWTQSDESAAGRTAGTADPFADWVLRPDVDGRLGWESPRLTEAQRWWARVREDQLPVAGWWRCLTP